MMMNFQKNIFKILDYIKISENEYWETIDQARPSNLWKQDGNKWILKTKLYNINPLYE